MGSFPQEADSEVDIRMRKLVRKSCGREGDRTGQRGTGETNLPCLAETPGHPRGVLKLG